MPDNHLNPSIPESLNPSIQRDLVPLAVSTVGFAVVLGTVIMTAFLLLNRSLVQDIPITPDARPDVNQPAATLLLVGVLCTLIIPMITTWGLLSPIPVVYRRFGFAMVSGLGAIVLSLVSVPANELFGVRGLVGLLLVATLAGVTLGVKVKKERVKL